MIANYNRPVPLFLMSDRQGFDGVSAAGDVQALIDQPVTAGGTRLQPELPAEIIIVQSTGAQNPTMRLLLLSTAQPDTSGKRMALV